MQVLRKKYGIFFLASSKSMMKGVGSGVGSGADPDPLFRGKDPRIRIRIRTKMSRIPNTGWMPRGERERESRDKITVTRSSDNTIHECSKHGTLC
jgi:hypothetical protein